MLAAPFKVVLDANVLYPFTLRDTLLRSAAAGFFQAYWSELLLEEATRNLVANSIVTADEPLIAGMKNDEKDRHVAAAAVKAGAQVIVTMNLSDFGDLPDGIEAQHPDEFLSNLFDLDPDSLTGIVQSQAADLKKPPRTFEEVVGALSKLVPDFAAAVRKHAST